MRELRGLSILITRPVGQAGSLARKISALGGDARVLSSLEIIPWTTNHLKNVITPKTVWQKVIFTSANAVNPVMPLWPLLYCSPEVLAIGAGTAEALAEHGIVAKIPADEFSSEGLLQMPELQKIERNKLAIFTGRAPRNVLAKELRLRGALVQIIPVYERRCPKVLMDEHWLKAQPARGMVIISTSSESLLNLCSMAKTPAAHEWLYRQQLLVISPRMAQLAQNLGFDLQALLAANASDQAVLEALIFYQRQGQVLAN